MSDDAALPDSLLPYDRWAEEALREVALRALEQVAAEGLPGEHHFYVTFRTDHPDTAIPARLKARYPEEMTIVLQHQFEDLIVDRRQGFFSVRLYFGGVPATLRVPFAALTMFHDPHVRFGLRFGPPAQQAAQPAPELEAEPEQPEAELPEAGAAPAEPGQVVSLDAFRRRPARDG